MAYDVDTVTALASGQLIIRDFLTVFGKTLGGSAATFCYWTGEDNIAQNVPPADGGTVESRNFVGGGTLLEVPAFADAVGLEVRSYTIGLDHISDAAGSPMDMVFGHNIRVARVEVHRGIFDPNTGNLVADPILIFFGRVDGAKLDDAAAGGEGGLSLEVVGSAVDLTKTNPAMESDEQQRLRSGDRFRRWSDTVAMLEIWWARVKGT